MKYIFVLLMVLWPLQARAVIPDNGGYEFEILRNAKPFGSHVVRFSKDGDNTIVDIDIEMKYDFGPFTLFRYKHSNRETWRGDKILSVDSVTNDDGDQYALFAKWTEEALIVNINDEVYETVPSMYSTSYWNPVALQSAQLLNTQKGIVEDIAIEKLGVEEIKVADSPVKADAYYIEASVPIKIWYDTKTRQWVKLAFEVRGSALEYIRKTPLKRIPD